MLELVFIMRIGASYNFFDGEEILPYSVKSIRNSVSYIVVVYQEISNYGNNISKEAKKVLKNLLDKKMVDDVILYKPGNIGRGAVNETRKRNIGLQLCRNNKCSHYLTIDADELYDEEEFNKAASIISSKGFYGSFCLFRDYFKYPTYQMIDNKPMTKQKNKSQRTSIPFLFKITNDTKHFHGAYNHIDWFKLLVDPTRMIIPLEKNHIKYFSPKELMMHHMSWVRKNITSKVENSSCNDSPQFRDRKEKIKKLYSSWDIGKSCPFAPPKNKINIVENKFGVKI